MRKDELYKLINLFLNHSINTIDFCDQYYDLYEFNLDGEKLDATEQKLYSELNYIISRFSMFPDEIEKYPNTYYSEIELREKAMTIMKALEAQHGEVSAYSKPKDIDCPKTGHT
jgi:hypothetical protein